jgi:sulfite exporter TauE/SafE/copper chaperone CopZ
MEKVYYQKLNIKGLHCLSCEIIIKDSLSALPELSSIKVDYKNGTLEFETSVENYDLASVTKIIKKHGYEIVDGKNKFPWLKFTSYLVIFLGLAWVLTKLNWMGGGGKLDSPLTALVFGVMASLSSCLAVVGGVVIALGSLWSETKSKTEQITSQILFQLGRFVSFVLLGGLLGVLGSVINFSVSYSAWLMIVIGLLMLMLAFKQLAIIIPKFYKKNNWLEKINKLSASKNPAMPFVLGALTFFLPCGFTQTVQLFSIASGSFVIGAITSGLFVLGTMPVLLLLGIGFGKFNKLGKPIFTKILAVVMGVFAIVIINNGFSLLGHPFFNSRLTSQTSTSNINNVVNDQGQQVVEMIVDYNGYTPNKMTVKVGVPVKWRLIVNELGGCNSAIIMPEYKISKQLKMGVNEITFTPTKKGKINFSCGMGMITGQFIVTE